MSHFNLLSLSTELILHIIDEVHPADIESLALGNKVIHNLCHAALQKHRDLKKQYSTISLGRGVFRPKFASTADERSFDGLNPLSLLIRFLANPHLAYYPTKLQIGNCRADGRNSEEVTRALDDICPTWKPNLAVYITNNPWLAQMDVEKRHQWQDALLEIDECSQGYYLGILLTMLPRIRSLFVFNMTFNDEFDPEFYNSAVAEIIYVIASVNRNPGSLIYGKALGALHTVTVVREEIDMFALFATLPSVHCLLGEKITGSFEHIDAAGTLRDAGQLEELDIKESSTDVACSEWMLSSMTGLKRLKYDGYDDVDILRTLKRHTAKSLERLELTVVNDSLWMPQMYQRLKSLRGFKVLRELKVDFEIFQRGDDGGLVRDLDEAYTRLVDVLPSSIRVLRLKGNRWLTPSRQLAAQITRKKAKLPELRRVIYETDFPAWLYDEV